MRSAVLLLLWLSPVATTPENGSCSYPKPLCCRGLNKSCIRDVCFCDEFCTQISDCCADYKAACHPSDSLPLRDNKAVLHVVMRMQSVPCLGSRDSNWMQSMVQKLLRSSLPGNHLSISVRGVRMKA